MMFSSWAARATDLDLDYPSGFDLYYDLYITLDALSETINLDTLDSLDVLLNRSLALY